MKLNPGDTVSYYFYFKDKNGALIDPDPSTLTFDVQDPSGNETSVTVTKIQTGTYEFNYNLPTDAALGIWKVLVHAEIGSFISSESVPFKVEAL